MSEAPYNNRSRVAKGRDVSILPGQPDLGLKGLHLGDRLMKHTLLLLFVVFLSGCAALLSPPGTPPPVQNDSETDFISPHLTHEGLKSGRLAILAVLSPGDPEGMEQNAAYEIFQGLRSSFRDVPIIPRSDAVKKIVSADQLPAYNAFVKNYQQRRVMSLDELKKWSEIEGVRYLFIGELGIVNKHTEARIMRGGESLVAGKISIFASGPNMIPEEVSKQVRLRGEIWDSRCGQMVWAGKGEAEVLEIAGQEQTRVEDIFMAAGRNLIGSLVKSIEGKPAPTKECP